MIWKKRWPKLRGVSNDADCWASEETYSSIVPCDTRRSTRPLTPELDSAVKEEVEDPVVDAGLTAVLVVCGEGEVLREPPRLGLTGTRLALEFMADEGDL